MLSSCIIGIIDAKIRIDSKIMVLSYPVLLDVGNSCLNRLHRVQLYGGKPDISLVWVSGYYVPNQDDIWYVEGHLGIKSMKCMYVKKLIEVLEYVTKAMGVYNRSWIEVILYTAGDNVGGPPVYSFDPEYQWYPDCVGTKAKDIIEELLKKFPNDVEMSRNATDTGGAIWIRLPRLNNVISYLEQNTCARFGIAEAVRISLW